MLLSLWLVVLVVLLLYAIVCYCVLLSWFVSIHHLILLHLVLISPAQVLLRGLPTFVSDAWQSTTRLFRPSHQQLVAQRLTFPFIISLVLWYLMELTEIVSTTWTFIDSINFHGFKVQLGDAVGLNQIVSCCFYNSFHHAPTVRSEGHSQGCWSDWAWLRDIRRQQGSVADGRWGYGWPMAVFR